MRTALLFTEMKETRSRLSKKGVWTNQRTDTGDYFVWGDRVEKLIAMKQKSEKACKDLYVLVPWKLPLDKVFEIIKGNDIYFFFAMDDVYESPADLVYHMHVAVSDAEKSGIIPKKTYNFFMRGCYNCLKKGVVRVEGLKKMMDAELAAHYTVVNRVDVEFSKYSPKVNLFQNMNTIGNLDIHIKDAFGLIEMTRLFAEYQKTNVMVENCRIYMWDGFFNGETPAEFMHEATIHLSKMLESMKQRAVMNDRLKNGIPGAYSLFLWDIETQAEYASRFFISDEGSFEKSYCNVSIHDDGITTPTKKYRVERNEYVLLQNFL